MALATSAYLVGNVDEAVRALQSGYQDRIRHADAWRRPLRLLARSDLERARRDSGRGRLGRSGADESSRVNRPTSSNAGTCFLTSSSSTSLAETSSGQARRLLISSRQVAASPNPTWSLKV